MVLLFYIIIMISFYYFSRLRPVAHRVRFLASHIEVNASQTKKNELKIEIPKA